MRYSFDRLGGIVNAHMKGNLLSGNIFIFVNKRKNQCKLLRWSEDGFEIFHKRLVKGTFAVPHNGQIEAYELQLMISGVGAIQKKETVFNKKCGIIFLLINYIYLQYE